VLVKNGWPVAGKRIVVAGSGPLLLAVARSLRAAGAQVLLVAEQATAMDLARFAARLARHPAKLAQAAALRLRLAGVPYRCNAWVERADGEEHVRSVRVRVGRYSERLDCDALAVGFGLVPNIEIAQLLGCTLADGAVAVDEHQHSSVAGIYFAGESCGIGGVDQALIQGEIAGRAAAGSARLSLGLRRARVRSEHFARSLERHFTLRDELRQLAAADTVLCRCENVRHGAAQACRTQRDARLQTRLGMGHCQGRVCGAACAFLFGWDAATPRPPLAPVPLSCFTVSPTEENPQESP
jgi:NADPH-dependent 2,4-dienoyl-CoA reductase/sulfur reductase-like enzyme